jgi:hypothetical protein
MSALHTYDITATIKMRVESSEGMSGAIAHVHSKVNSGLDDGKLPLSCPSHIQTFEITGVEAAKYA